MGAAQDAEVEDRVLLCRSTQCSRGTVKKSSDPTRRHQGLSCFLEEDAVPGEPLSQPGRAGLAPHFQSEIKGQDTFELKSDSTEN